MKVLDDNDSDYLAWVERHPKEFVLNTRRTPDPDYMVLHRASCQSISRYTAVSTVGGFVERFYIKAFVDTIGALREWVRRNGRADGSFSKECGFCNPLRRLSFSHDTL